MADWPDKKIQSTVLWYIGKHTTRLATWRKTRLGEAHPEVLAHVVLDSGELPVVSFFLSNASWYLFTTRRVLGAHAGQRVDVPVLDVSQFNPGNFKGYGDLTGIDPQGYGKRKTEVMRFQLRDGSAVTLEYETCAASMAPIYFMRYWNYKFPILDKLNTRL